MVDDGHKKMLHKPLRRYVLVLIGFATLFIAAWSVYRHIISMPQATVEVLEQQSLDVRGVTRHYRLVVPKLQKDSANLPILFVFHGAGETSERMAHYTRLDQLAAEGNCVVVYPQGKRLSWPVVVSDENPNYLNDDLAFFDELLTRLADKYPIDPNHVYALGMSQGGTFVTLLVAKRSDRLAGVVSHSSWLPKPLAKHGIHAQYKLPVMFIAGEEDVTVPPEQTRQAFEQFKTEGHLAEFYLLPGVGHHWATDGNIDRWIWQFLSVHARQ